MEKSESLKNMTSIKVKGWVARNEGDDQLLFGDKPKRGNRRDHTEDYWILSNKVPVDYNVWSLPSEMFPDIKWEDEPVEVEITIEKTNR